MPPKKKPAREAVTVSDEISFEDEEEPTRKTKAISTPPPPMPGGAQPIADLLSSEAEEEIELLSITSDEEAAGERPMSNPKISSDEADLEAAFDKVGPHAAPSPKKVPAKKVPLFDDLSQEAFVELVNKLGVPNVDVVATGVRRLRLQSPEISCAQLRRVPFYFVFRLCRRALRQCGDRWPFPVRFPSLPAWW